MSTPAPGTDPRPDTRSDTASSSAGAALADAAAPTGASRTGPDLPLRMLHDRLLVELGADAAERRTGAGILIPATAAVGKRLAWAVVVAAGEHVRQVRVGDRVLFDPEDRAEVELAGRTYLLLREKDVHGVADPEVGGAGTGLYL